MRERVAPPPPGRMRAGVRSRCGHASGRFRARPCNCSAISIFELPTLVNYINTLCPKPLGSPPPDTQIG